MKSPSSLSTSQPKSALPQNRAEVAKEWFFLWSLLWEVRNCYVTRHIRTNGKETLQRSQCFCWKSDHVEEEEKEFSNLNEGEERKAETGQDEGKTDTQKNRMKGRSDAKAGTTKDKETGETHFHSLNIHMLSDGHWEPTGMGGKQRGAPSTAWIQRITPHHCCELFSSHTHIVLRIRGCQVPSTIASTCLTGLVPNPNKLSGRNTLCTQRWVTLGIQNFGNCCTETMPC